MAAIGIWGLASSNTARADQRAQALDGEVLSEQVLEEEFGAEERWPTQQNWYYVKSDDGTCLEAGGDGGEDAPAFLADCDGDDSQQYRIYSTGDGYYEISSKQSGMCLGVDDASMEEGAEVSQWECTGDDNQQYRMYNAGGGYYYLRARHSGMCLEAEESAGPGDSLFQSECEEGNEDQLFTFEPAES